MLVDILVKGIVQGVGFRPFVYRLAIKNKLNGFVQNRGDSNLRIIVEGKEEHVNNFITELKTRKPPLSEIHDLNIDYRTDKGEFSTFEIKESFKGGEERGSTLPPDISICNECLSEMRTPTNHRFKYFFITCTDCGPRYTIIQTVPYDRINTSMNYFKMCSDCDREYRSPADRRFHAQTNACSRCGPQLTLTTGKGETVNTKDPISEAGRFLNEGYILGVKGNGGFHLVCSTTNPKPISTLRSVKERNAKPFAVMARDLQSARSFAQISDLEAELLELHSRPIILLKKRQDYCLSDLLSPGLHTIGVMLPYTGLHYLMFDSVSDLALVMTSANPPNEPIIIDNDVAFKRLGNVADYFLLHNRRIEQRCDDSVLRVIGRNVAFLRRSRGYAPAPITLKYLYRNDVFAFGAELNATCCVLIGQRAYISQHLGDVETPETLNFLKATVKHLLNLTKAQPSVLACDLHPKFNTTYLAKSLSEEMKVPVVQVQHHHAHLSKLMAEHGSDEAVGIVCDGYGYGADGNAWGGEILYSNIESFKRVGHLQEQPMIGGDLATKYPIRMAAGILQEQINVKDFLEKNVTHIPHGLAEVDIILRQIEHRKSYATSSCGRVLDAVSAVLGICYERTYEGEPAMKLESEAFHGKDVLDLGVRIDGNVIDTDFLLKQVYSNLCNFSIADLAFSAQSYLARSLAELAVQCASDEDVSTVGFTGGVACNEHISNTIKSIVENSGLTFLAHNRIPPGDGGISLGQAVVAGQAI